MTTTVLEPVLDGPPEPLILATADLYRHAQALQKIYRDHIPEVWPFGEGQVHLVTTFPSLDARQLVCRMGAVLNVTRDTTDALMPFWTGSTPEGVHVFVTSRALTPLAAHNHAGRGATNTATEDPR